MKTTSLISVGGVVALVALGTAIYLARPDAARNGASVSQAAPAAYTANGALVASETRFDFGVISMAAGSVAHTFTVRNAGTEPVTVEKMYTSCMCTTAGLTAGGRSFGPYGMPGHGFIPRIGQALASGEEALVEVVFDPAAHGPAGVGRIERAISIENSAGKPLELTIAATVRP